MFESDEHGIPHEQLSEFANSLFDYLYFELDITYSYSANTSEHFREAMGRAVISIDRETYDFNQNVLSTGGYGVDRLVLCQRMCSLYPDDDYFKKLYYISRFILDAVLWGYQSLDPVDLSMGPKLWIMIFQSDFERTFDIEGGWHRFEEVGREQCRTTGDGILPNDKILNIYSRNVFASMGCYINKPSGPVDVTELLRSFQKFEIQRLESDNAFVDEVPRVEEAVEENQPGEMVVEEADELEDNREEEVDDRPPALFWNIDQSEQPCGSGSGNLEEGALPTRENRNLLKRRHESPPESDSDADQDSVSPSDAKIERK